MGYIKMQAVGPGQCVMKAELSAFFEGCGTTWMPAPDGQPMKDWPGQAEDPGRGELVLVNPPAGRPPPVGPKDAADAADRRDLPPGRRRRSPRRREVHEVVQQVERKKNKPTAIIQAQAEVVQGPRRRIDGREILKKNKNCTRRSGGRSGRVQGARRPTCTNNMQTGDGLHEAQEACASATSRAPSISLRDRQDAGMAGRRVTPRTGSPCL